MDPDRDLATSAESSKGGAFRGYGETGTGIVEDGECLDGRFIVCTRFDSEGSLACSGTKNEGRKSFAEVLGAFEALKAGGGQNDRLRFTLRQLAEAGVDVAAKLKKVQVVTNRPELRLAPQAACSDACAGWESSKAFKVDGDEGVAGIGTRRDGGDGERLRRVKSADP